MARIEPEQLRDPERICLARSLKRAREVEERLSTRGIDYAVQVESFGKSLLFGTERVGAAFYVNAGQASYCRQHLTEAGFGHDVVTADESE